MFRETRTRSYSTGPNKRWHFYDSTKGPRSQNFDDIFRKPRLMGHVNLIVYLAGFFWNGERIFVLVAVGYSCLGWTLWPNLKKSCECGVYDVSNNK